MQKKIEEIFGWVAQRKNWFCGLVLLIVFVDALTDFINTDVMKVKMNYDVQVKATIEDGKIVSVTAVETNNTERVSELEEGLPVKVYRQKRLPSLSDVPLYCVYRKSHTGMVEDDLVFVFNEHEEKGRVYFKYRYSSDTDMPVFIDMFDDDSMEKVSCSSRIEE